MRAWAVWTARRRSTTFSSTKILFGDHQINPIGAVDGQSLVGEGDGDLTTKRDASKGQLVAKARLVGRLQKPRTELAVNLDASPDHDLGAVSEPGRSFVVGHSWCSATLSQSFRCATAPPPVHEVPFESERAGPEGTTGRRGVWKAGVGQASMAAVEWIVLLRCPDWRPGRRASVQNAASHERPARQSGLCHEDPELVRDVPP